MFSLFLLNKHCRYSKETFFKINILQDMFTLYNLTIIKSENCSK